MRVIFVNYGLFNSNSGGHVAHFANALSALGVDVFVIGSNDPSTVEDFGRPLFKAIQVRDLTDDIPQHILDLASSPDVLLHAWTPRVGVQDFASRLSAQTGCPYVVHLEDHEVMLLASALRKTMGDLDTMSDAELAQLTPSNLTNPRTLPSFLGGAIGVTVIVDRLAELCPPEVPIHLLEPGVDADLFKCDLTADQILERRRRLYIDDKATVLVYNGNMHSANYRDIFSLYTAVLILRRRGHDVRLIRTGEDYVGFIDSSYKYLNGDWVINLGRLDRQQMIDVLKIADIYVQPGESKGFNAFRLPSKVPEFLSLGKPILLPSANIGTRLSDGKNAILLSTGNGEEIANRVEDLLSHPDRIAKIGVSGRQFALENLSWSKNAEGLLSFYKSVLR
ncbi:Glycosyltransferase involved in cell wall bisynthesis [Methylobacterium phyllostachyos]|uniref:Glycosyltransferase involved in cell wall bisynthesis n=1 Tax=Methylobacterium phyllostachyos TaxID=582672 RepID=A0A1H0B261_9HYPH|nr:glycosyltransferase family 4 protein [Methylobacterium phyllostachyos]SDN39393.1 Glycosyltransferase involved in cell wall bisynthesis [Methylobacterium phyllostachyos]